MDSSVDDPEIRQLLECPFCSTDGIKYGSSMCRGCQAEIDYVNTAERNTTSTARVILGVGFMTAFIGGIGFDAPLFAGIAILLMFGGLVHNKMKYEKSDAEEVRFRRRGGGRGFVSVGWFQTFD